MKKKRKNKSMYLLLMLLLLASAGFATYAIYKTSASGTANVSAANWVVKVTANGSTTNVTGGSNSINLGECANRLAPGSSCTIPFTVDMTESEVDSILTVGIGNSIDASTLALMNEAELSLKISDGTTEGYSYVLPYGTTKQLNLVIDWEAGLESDDNKASADVAISKIVGGLTIPVNMIVKQYNGGGESTASTYTVGQEVYFDPTKSDQSECNDTDHTGATCMIWRLISSDDDNVTLQLNHNLVNKVAWISAGDYGDINDVKTDKGPITPLTLLASETSTWTNVDPLNYTYDTSENIYNYGILSCINGTCTIGSNTINNVKARMITAEEVAAITSEQTPGNDTIADTFTLKNGYWFYFSRTDKTIGRQYDGEGNKNLSWLIENTMLPEDGYDSGSTPNAYGEDNYGYWTLSPRIISPHWAFNVGRNGSLSDNYIYIDNGTYCGARPVITIPKSKLQ